MLDSELFVENIYVGHYSVYYTYSQNTMTDIIRSDRSFAILFYSMFNVIPQYLLNIILTYSMQNLNLKSA